MGHDFRDAVPIASAAAWSPDAAPAQRPEPRRLTLDETPAPPEVAPVAPPAPAVDRLGALRDIARRLRSSPESDETLQFVIDKICEVTDSAAAMLTLSAPQSRQFVAGSALGAGPYISVPLRVGGPTFGELVLTRMLDAPEYEAEDETVSDLVAEYVAKAASAQRRGTVLSDEEQDFIDRVTQELRSPLAGACNVIDVVLAGELPADAARYLGSAAGDLRRLSRTVEDLLRLAHLRPPDLREMEAVPVGPWLQRAVERFSARAQGRGVSLTYRPTPEAYVVQGVPGQLDIVIDALIDNAVTFTESGGRVDVTAGLMDSALRVSVRDNGIGFDPAEAARMLECFARAITAEAARIPGLGVGLFLANQIVGQHGGRLWLESRRDEGTQAHVALPPRVEV